MLPESRACSWRNGQETVDRRCNRLQAQRRSWLFWCGLLLQFEVIGFTHNHCLTCERCFKTRLWDKSCRDVVLQCLSFLCKTQTVGCTAQMLFGWTYRSLAVTLNPAIRPSCPGRLIQLQGIIGSLRVRVRLQLANFFRRIGLFSNRRSSLSHVLLLTFASQQSQHTTPYLLTDFLPFLSLSPSSSPR